MIIYEIKPYQDAVAKHRDSASRIAHKADSSPTTMSRLLKGETDLNLTSVEKLADYLGFDVQVSFIVKQKETAAV